MRGKIKRLKLGNMWVAPGIFLILCFILLSNRLIQISALKQRVFERSDALKKELIFKVFLH